jgi:hypothetical protein
MSKAENNPGCQNEDMPKIGDPIYIPSELYVSHGVDDLRGGLTEIATVEPLGDGSYWITTKFDTASQYNWSSLKVQQAELAKEFGQAPPQNTPDYRPEFNDGWD